MRRVLPSAPSSKPFRDGFAPTRALVVVVGLGSALLAADFADAGGRSTTTNGCAPLARLETVFPAARAVGFTGRTRIKVQEARSPVFPGRCGAFWTTYTGLDGKRMDVDVTLYKTAKDVGAPLAEPLAGTVHLLPNGARVRYSGPDPGSVNGTPSSSIFVVSAFRRLFIGSVSISTSMKPVSISGQLRIHRDIENGYTRLVATH